MEKRTPSQQIDHLAAEWAAKSDGRPLSAGEEAALEAWLAADPRHLGAFAKARAIAVHTERARALGPHFDADKFAPSSALPTLAPLVLNHSLSEGGIDGDADAQSVSPLHVDTRHKDIGLSRRRAILMGGTAAAAAGLFFGGRLAMQLLLGRSYGTGIGETRVVPLEDGSVVTLNTTSQIRVDYTPDRRHIVLVEGEALFDVAKNKQRPFVVEAGDTQVRAVGTSFTVSRLPGEPVQVLVREGIVEVKRPNVPTAPPVRLAANTTAVAPSDAPIAVAAIAPAETNRALAWRVGRIAFEGETLKQAAEKFGRYSDIKIVISNPEIADETITGLYVSNDPVGFAKAVAVSLDLKVQVSADEVRLTR